MNDLDIRFSSDLEIEIRAGGEGRSIEGYAAVWNVLSGDLGYFKEILEPRLFAAYLQSREADVIATVNHRRDAVPFARFYGARKGSLQLIEDSKGLQIAFDAPRTAAGDELIQAIERGDMRGMSFAFRAEEETWKEKEGKMPIRRVMRATLHDVSVVTNPAYSKTSVSVRSMPVDLLAAIEARELPVADKESLIAAIVCISQGIDIAENNEVIERYRDFLGELNMTGGISEASRLFLPSAVNYRRDLDYKARQVQFARTHLTNDIESL